MCEGAGVPAVVVVTEVFENLARTAARAQGYPDLRVLVLPHPMENRPPDEIDRICDQRFDEAVALLITKRER